MTPITSGASGNAKHMRILYSLNKLCSKQSFSCSLTNMSYAVGPWDPNFPGLGIKHLMVLINENRREK